MNREEILEVLKSLASSQGFYGRLLASLNNASEDEREEFLCNLESQNFADSLDLIMYIEG